MGINLWNSSLFNKHPLTTVFESSAQRVYHDELPCAALRAVRRPFIHVIGTGLGQSISVSAVRAGNSHFHGTLRACRCTAPNVHL